MTSTSLFTGKCKTNRTCTVIGLSKSRHKHMGSTIAFDAHNHIHLSKEGGIPPLSTSELLQSSVPLEEGEIKPPSAANETITPRNQSNCKTINVCSHAIKILTSLRMSQAMLRRAASVTDAAEIQDRGKLQVGGMALMSTQPRDFPIVQKLSDSLVHLSKTEATKNANFDCVNDDGGECATLDIVRNYGVHPWFLQQAQLDFAKRNHFETDISKDDVNDSSSLPWLSYLRYKIESDTLAHVGEIGLDGARYDIDPDTNQKILVSTMESQIEAFEAQMHLAADMDRSVSIHAVRCWGPLMESLKRIKDTRAKLRKENRTRRKELKRQLELSDRDTDLLEEYKNIDEDILLFPRNIYFHAFGGKTAVVDQLDSICCGKKYDNSSTVSVETFYGFAPIVNFRSPKTASIIQKIGIHRLLLETDVEDFSRLSSDLQSNIAYIAEALDMQEEEVLRQTNSNARRLYRLVP